MKEREIKSENDSWTKREREMYKNLEKRKK